MNDRPELEMDELKPKPFHARWQHPQWAGYLVVLTTIGAVALTLVIGLVGGLFRNATVVDFAKFGLTAEFTSLATTLGLYRAWRIPKPRGRS